MAIETTGKTFKFFYTDKEWWVGDCYHDDEVIYVNGVETHDLCSENIPDDSIVRIEGGEIIDHPRYEGFGLDDFFELWLKEQTNMTLLIQFPKEHHARVNLALLKLGQEIGLEIL